MTESEEENLRKEPQRRKKMTITHLLSFFAGIGLFLYGINAMGDGLEYAAGSKMKKILIMT